MSVAWKSAEKEVAEYFGGVRRVRVSYSESVGDVIHPEYSIEVKYGKQVPKYMVPQWPVVLTVDGVKYVTMPSGMFLQHTIRKTLEPMWCALITREVSGEFLTQAFEQAERYYPDKRPIVCCKRPRQRGFNVIWRWK